MGVAIGCGFKEIYRFPHTTYPYTPLVSVLFCSSIPAFLFIFFNVFRSYINYSMILNNYKKNECACHDSEIITFLESLFPYT